MQNLRFVLLVFSFVLFVVSIWAASQNPPWWNRLVSAGLACAVASAIF